LRRALTKSVTRDPLAPPLIELSSFRPYLSAPAVGYRCIAWATCSISETPSVFSGSCLARNGEASDHCQTPPLLKEDHMEKIDSVVAVFADHNAAEAAVKKLAATGFEMKNLSVVGKGYHTDEKVVGFYNTGDRIKFWGSRGAFWGGFWGLFFGGLFMTVPVVGHVVVLGYLAAMAISALETAAVVGGVSALAAALYGIGIPKNSVIEYETAVKADDFLVMAHGSAADMARAKTILGAADAKRVDAYAGVKAAEPEDRHLVRAAG
jgi:hypothetical protein